MDDEKTLDNVDAKIAVYVPLKSISLIKKTFNLKDSEIEDFLVSLIQRTAEGQSSHDNVFSPNEAKEIEDNLKGLGYI